jgi:hypothetical protein
MPEVIQSLIRFLRRALSDLPGSIGSNNLGVWFPAIPTILFFVYQWRQNGWAGVKHDLIVGTVITVISYALLFCYCVVRNLYREHVALVAKVVWLNPLQVDMLQLSMDMVKFVRDAEPRPILKYSETDIEVMRAERMKELYLAKDPDFIEAMAFYDRTDLSITPEHHAAGLNVRYQRLFPWGQRVGAKYNNELRPRVETICNRLVAEGILENQATFTVTGYPDVDTQILGLANKLWQLAYQASAKGEGLMKTSEYHEGPEALAKF